MKINPARGGLVVGISFWQKENGYRESEVTILFFGFFSLTLRDDWNDVTVQPFSRSVVCIPSVVSIE